MGEATMQDVMERFLPTIADRTFSNEQLNAIRCIRNCRTAEMGAHVSECESCHSTFIYYKITYEAITGEKTNDFSKTLQAGTPFVTGYPGLKGTKVFGVAHCGALGSRNVGGMPNMKKAWRIIANEFCDSRRILEVELDDAVLKQLIHFSEDWAAENSCYGYRANDRSDIEGNRIFFAEEDGKVVGYLFGKVYKSENMQAVMPKGTPYFEVEELYVIPERRSCGIGQSLFKYVEEAVKYEAKYMVLSTATKNWKAIFHFYIDELDMQFWNARLFRKIER